VGRCEHDQATDFQGLIQKAMSRIRNTLLTAEWGLSTSRVADESRALARVRPRLWDRPVAFVLSSLEVAGVPMAERRLEFGESIYGRGDPDRHLYFLVEGVVKLYKGYRVHKEAIVTLLEEGNVFGEPAPHSEGIHRDSAEAASACRVAAVGKVALEQHVQQDSRCALALLVAYAQWVQRHERAMERLVPRDIRPRLAASLLELADRLGEPTEDGVVIKVHLIHQTLADTIVSSRVGVSKEMARFRREGLIEAQGRGRIVLLDETRLSEIAQSK
jgi:CRP/FNR family transcriptional regulator, cyclic AMP receptor protein